jgi:hypothetical protein
MAELRISAEVMEELNRMAKRLSEGDTKDIERDFERIRAKVEIPPEITTKGVECAACNSCGVCSESSNPRIVYLINTVFFVPAP